MTPSAGPDRLTVSSPTPALARTLGLAALTIYGVGDMLGSGIYALIGKAAGTMGNAVWLAFLVSMVAAVLTGLSYAALGSRYPRAAGAAFVTERAFGWPFLAYVVGLTVMASGLTSMGTQTRAFASYFTGMFGGTTVVVMLGFIAALTLVNWWGMREATWLNVLCTTVELAGLVIVIAVGIRFWGRVDYWETPTPMGPALALQGAVLTFYSFIGFEDMINVSEEVKEPERNFPIAVVLALAIVTVVYLAVSISAVSVVPHRELAESKRPLVEVVLRAWPAFPPVVFALIALFAITNTGLLNYIMGSRLVYGMARQGLLPQWLGAVHPRRRTPHRAIFTLMVIVVVLALVGDISVLASATSALLLCVFVVINAALVVLQRRPGEPPGRFEVPLVVPVGGIIVCLLLLTQVRWQALAIAGVLVAVIAALYFVTGRRGATSDKLPA
ncbi:MAG: putative amino acid permease YhdG [Verrucomicrobiae bacterium]|nr:putative amino acid permease YhdG [Verrucomicrobiae bacterium]